MQYMLLLKIFDEIRSVMLSYPFIKLFLTIFQLGYFVVNGVNRYRQCLKKKLQLEIK